MDGSDTRRGMPSAHRRFAALHRGNGWLGVARGVRRRRRRSCRRPVPVVVRRDVRRRRACPTEALHRGRAVCDRMRTELMAGQYLDLLEQARGRDSVDAGPRT